MTSMTGGCDLYLYHEGTVELIAPLRLTGLTGASGVNDVSDLLPSADFGGPGAYPRTSFLAADGSTLVFRSTEKLTDYDNHGSPEYYRYRAGQPSLGCLTCNPTGAAPSAAPKLASYQFPGIGSAGEPPAALVPRNLADEGRRFFFETTEALVGADTDGQGGCPVVGTLSQNYSVCQDVYEWEAPGAGSCEEASFAYSSQDGGCLYLLSPGDDAQPALFADASESGEDVFFFVRAPLVGQDGDRLLDVYDARARGGLAAQNPLAEVPCEGEACKRGASPAPVLPSPVTPGFQGPGNVREKPRPSCPKGKRKVRRHGKPRCVNSHRRHKRAHTERGGSR
jgi:hypothetical protein